MEKTTNRYSELGKFLKTRRNNIKPEQLGITSGKRRRTPGLRREEVAQLASVGLTWYTWLEQGREINVSESILDSLSKVFMLTEEERIHLYTLANKSLPPKPNNIKHINSRILHLFKKFDLLYSPAYIVNEHWDIVMHNKSSEIVFGAFDFLPSEEQNMINLMFNNRQYKSLFQDWDIHAKEMLSRFHTTFAKNIDDPWFNNFILQMKNTSEDFSSWWLMYEVNSMTDIVKDIRHPILGKLTFDFVILDIVDIPNLQMIIYSPDDKTLQTLKHI